MVLPLCKIVGVHHNNQQIEGERSNPIDEEINQQPWPWQAQHEHRMCEIGKASLEREREAIEKKIKYYFIIFYEQ